MSKDLTVTQPQEEKQGVFGWMFGGIGYYVDKAWQQVPDFKGPFSLSSKANQAVERVQPFIEFLNDSVQPLKESLQSWQTFKDKISECPPQGYLPVKLAFIFLLLLWAMIKVYNLIDFVLSFPLAILTRTDTPSNDNDDAYIAMLMKGIDRLNDSIRYYYATNIFLIGYAVVATIIILKNHLQGGRKHDSEIKIPKSKSQNQNSKINHKGKVAPLCNMPIKVGPHQSGVVSCKKPNKVDRPRSSLPSKPDQAKKLI